MFTHSWYQNNTEDQWENASLYRLHFYKMKWEEISALIPFQQFSLKTAQEVPGPQIEDLSMAGFAQWY